MADRRTPLTALSILGRRPGVDVRPARPTPRPPPPALPPRARRPGVAARPPGPTPAAPATETRRASQLIDNAVYSAGRRIATPESPADSRAELDEGEERLAWLGLYR